MSGSDVPFLLSQPQSATHTDNDSSGSPATEVRSGEMVVDSAGSSNVAVNHQDPSEPPPAASPSLTGLSSPISSTGSNNRRPPPPGLSAYQPPAKRARYDGCQSGNKPSTQVEVRQEIVKWKRFKMDCIRKSYNSHVAEYFYLKHNGNLMEMSNWLKKPSPELLSYHKQHRLEGDTTNLAVAAREAGMKLSSGLAGTGASKKEDQQDQIVEKARHEAQVVARIAHLRKEGLWTEKRLPKVHEPPRPKCHWDYLLEEMVWLSADFAQERKWKKAAAKKCAKMVQKYFLDKELAAERAEKEEEMRLKKIASFMAREVRAFWNSVEKLVHYKINSKHDEKKKKALDQQLSFIVDQTEKYSGMLAESMKRPADSSAVSTRSETPSIGSLSDDEFEPSGPSSDDEETILKEDDDPQQQADEVKMLQQESSQTIDDLLTSLPPEYLASLRVQAEIQEDTSQAALSASGSFASVSGADSTNRLVTASLPIEDSSLLLSPVTRSGRKRRLSSHSIPEELTRESRQQHEQSSASETDVNSSKLGKQSSVDSSSSNKESSDKCVDRTTNDLTNDHEAMELDEADAEYVGEDEEDEEDTLAEQEKHEGPSNHKEEIKELEADNELSLDELKRKYAAMSSPPETPASDSHEGSSDEADDDDDDDDDESESPSSPRVSAGEGLTGSESSEGEEEDGLECLLGDTSVHSGDTSMTAKAADQELEQATAVAEALQPKGFTLSSAVVTTAVPFLLKHSLREYQHVGLDWLTTMFDKKLNGILADEMGLGKTIQTISLLAHLACEGGNWGPHLIVVPTSVMLNWEMELKKWCPAFKILTYFGSQKERKLKRTGWTKPNAFHVCITSYKLVIQDHQSFRRKKWKYFILDEAQNIKNFKSKRWQLLLNFQSNSRLLLTGTPLQNNLMELWSLMHFLMPHVFASHREFKEWFSNPVTGMIQGNSEYNDNIIKRLHKVLRPFILRRLKSEVEQQMPKKYEHVVMCRLSKRQRFLYEEFMSRTKTRETLAAGNFLSVINVLMQLRKVCNHPNLFEERPTVSPLMMEPVSFVAPSCCWGIVSYDPWKHVDLFSLNLLLCDLELSLTAFAAHRIRRFQCSQRLITEIDSAPPPPPRCPPGKIRLHVRQTNRSSTSAPQSSSGLPRPRPAPAPPAAAPTAGPLAATNFRYQLVQHQAPGVKAGPRGPLTGVVTRPPTPTKLPLSSAQPLQSLQLMHTPSGQLLLTTATRPQQGTALTAHQGVSSSSATALLQKLQSIQGIKSLQGSVITVGPGGRPVLRLPPPTAGVRPPLSTTVTTTATTRPVATTASTIAAALQNAALASRVPLHSTAQIIHPSAQSLTPQGTPQHTPHPTPLPSPTPASSPAESRSPARSTRYAVRDTKADDIKRSVFYLNELEEAEKERRRQKLLLLSRLNTRKCRACPIYGGDLVEAVSLPRRLDEEYETPRSWRMPTALHHFIRSPMERLGTMQGKLSQFVFCVPAVVSRQPQLVLHHPDPSAVLQLQHTERQIHQQLRPVATALHSIANATLTQFPDPRLMQYDCGKLQTLDHLLRRLKAGSHRVLIFTQMTRMLDVFEAFLNYHGHIYLRLDGTTKVQDRQVLMERFNQDKRIFVFILSTRSGGIGVNLTGADTVIFYDSDWNPTMDAQAQDRCHRIGQTRDVHIYRLISEKTIEENILKKANQKRMLGNLAIEGGNFTTAYFREQTIQELFSVSTEQDASHRMAELLEAPGGGASSDAPLRPGALESALAAAEDETDVVAARHAMAEAAADLAEFDENIPLNDDSRTQGEEEPSKVQQELDKLMEQLTGVERYAMHVLERADEGIAHEQLRLEQQLEQQKREWELDRKRALRNNEQMMASGRLHSDDEPLSVSGSQVNEGSDESSSEETDSSEEEGGGSDEEEEEDEEEEGEAVGESEQQDVMSRLTGISTSGNKASPGQTEASPRTRSRVQVDIDLWTLDEREKSVGKESGRGSENEEEEEGVESNNEEEVVDGGKNVDTRGLAEGKVEPISNSGDVEAGGDTLANTVQSRQDDSGNATEKDGNGLEEMNCASIHSTNGNVSNDVAADMETSPFANIRIDIPSIIPESDANCAVNKSVLSNCSASVAGSNGSYAKSQNMRLLDEDLPVKELASEAVMPTLSFPNSDEVVH